MRNTYSRPFLTYSILAILLMLGLGLILGQLTRNFVVDVIEERVEDEAVFLSNTLEGQSDLRDLDGLSRDLDLGLAFISSSGEILHNSASEKLELTDVEDEHFKAYMNEIENGDHRNKQGTIKENLFFYPFEINSPQLEGSLIVVVTIDSLSNITSNIWLLIAATLLIAIVVMVILGKNIFEKYVKPIRSASRVANELAEGNYRARTYEGHFGEAAQLTHSINVLARNLQEMTMQQEMQQDRLEAVINNMGSGLMLIDEKGYINLVNRAFLESFGGGKFDYLGFLYYEAVDQEEIHKSVKSVFMTEDRVRESFILPLQIERRFMEVVGAPIFSEGKEWKGVVLVFHDITELKNLEQMRKDFVANVSHELKTPITSIRGFSETLLEGAMDDAGLREQFLSIILKESQRLQSLITDLLELSKLEKEEFQLQLEQVQIKELIEDIVPIVLHQAQEKGVSLETDLTVNPVIEGDSARLKQVIINLITNAINYTQQSGSVYVHLSELQHEIKIAVTDTGVGIPEEDIPRIFERFYRVDKARSRNSGGTGLGLAIVKHIVEAHQGRIEVESVYEEGTTFYIYLPKSLLKVNKQFN
ncbi:alkaline phosphatase [Pontibacillus halophilus JSM 076056 = DSM 19796]|uniref:histidine kinase n=1 Tax=Pontibacillus halophilus JSM 076056 = DSM 19796 TaxID=1385510 RepID=A0A0A5IC15_9BACI|nr:HAMP domain-containing sensor histidine kinase [Pontibacillus halophilus]KGX93387.1 alkaline phosphatase [Pontibacillus halophilus JSM 076056 = DSM 19796]